MQVKDVWSAVKCRGNADCQVCRDKGCDHCASGSIGQAIFKVNSVIRIIPSAVFNSFSKEEKETGNFCGMATAVCQKFDGLYEKIPDDLKPWVDAILDKAHLEQPEVNGCQSGGVLSKVSGVSVLSLALISFGLAAV